MYRQMLVSNYNTKVSERRRMLNQREYQLLLHLLDETEPVDPFAPNPSREITLKELLLRVRERRIQQGNETHLIRELVRLNELGFINLNHQQGSELSLEIDFGAIARYRIS